MEAEVEYEKRRTKRSRKRHLTICLILTCLLLVIIIGLVLFFIVVPLLSKEETLDFRLPTNLVPQLYVLQIHPHLIKDNFTFEGNVTITVICISSTRRIILHSKGLDISETNIIGSDSNPTIKSVKKYNKNDFLILHTKEDLKENNRYQIRISFSGYLNDNNKGFYWKNYTYDGQTKYMAATNFKPTYARTAFPCFDEPAMKASFDITIIRSKRERSLSNMPRKVIEDRENLEADIYNPTIKLSTHLVSFFVGDFHSVDIKGPERTSVLIWATTKNNANKIKYEMGKPIELLDKYLKRLRFPSTQEKIDILAIPNESGEPIAEFGKDGALGCWGLITLDEYYLYFDRKEDLGRKQIATSQLAHAFAHQLFGNIVTPKWWDDAWLSESIATYLEIVGIDELFPEWNWITKSIISLSKHIEDDCSNVPYMTSMTVDKPAKIKEQLNNFAVSFKGWRILRMVNYIMGDDRFWAGVSNFIKDNAFKSVNQDEFWNYVTETQSKQYRLDLKSLIDNWIRNPGHPLVTVNRQDSSNTFRLQQDSCRGDASTLWKIPVTYIAEKKKNKREKVDVWLLSSNGSIETSIDKFDWIVVNSEQMGFYQVNYEKENWELLANKLVEDYREIPEVNRYQLLYDSLYFARKNLSSYENFLNILTYLEKENSDEVIEFLAVANISDIGKMLRRRAQKNWKEYIGKITKELYERKQLATKYDEIAESETKLALKKEILTGVCSVDEPSCVKLAIKKFDEWIKKEESINRNDHPMIKLFLCTAIRDDKDRWDNVETYFNQLKGRFPAEDVIYALGCIEDQFKLHRVLNIGLFEDVKYLPSIFESILENSNWIVIFDILNSEWNRLQKNADTFKKTMEILTDVIANKEELAKMNELYEKNKEHTTKIQKNLLEILIDKAEKRISDMDNQLSDIIQWLERKSWIRG